MIPLGLSILSSSVLLVIFKYFGKFKIKTFQAITVNYFVAATLGFLLAPGVWSINELIHKNWLPSALIIGCVFIAMFYVMAISSQKVGVAVSSVSNKMSLIIPVIAGVVLYNESLMGLKLIGVIVAMVGVIMVTYPKKEVHIDKKFLILPLIIFLGSGFLDTFFKYVETYQIQTDEIALFSATLFLIAAIAGSAVLIFNQLKNNVGIELRSVSAGFVLGVPNYFSIHFLLVALNLPDMESTLIFPVNNTGIVLLSTLLAIVLFKEKLSKLNWIGIVLAIVSIIMIAAS